MTVTESPDELTLRAEEVGTWKTYINVDHIEKERWGPLLVDYDWYAFCQALYKGIEGEDWGDMYDAYREMSRAVGVRRQPRMRVKNTTIHPGEKQEKISTLGRAHQRSD